MMKRVTAKESVVAKRPVVRKKEKSPIMMKSSDTVPVKPSAVGVDKLDLNLNKKQSKIKKPDIDSLEVSKAIDSRQFSSRFKISAFRELHPLPLLRDAPVNERQHLLTEKLRQASVVFDFMELTSDLKYKEVKKNALLEILDYFTNISQINFSNNIYEEVICMIGTNIFRALPPPVSLVFDAEGDEDEPLLEPAWPHLQHVYEVFLRFLEHTEFSVINAKQHIDANFIIHLMELFHSEDGRERHYLKTILHRIYGKMINHRPFIRKLIYNYFLKQVYEDECFRGTCELLEIMGSIINGYQVPLKAEHKHFLRNILLPLYKVSSLSFYQPALSYCITEFIRKDSSLLQVVVLQGLLKFWPKTHSLKELIFLYELEVLIELGSMETLRPLAKPISLQSAKCISSQHFQVCERILMFWQNSHFQNFMSTNIDVFMPITLPSLMDARQHWNKQIIVLVKEALDFFMNKNKSLYDNCISHMNNKQSGADEYQRRRQWWNNVERLAKQNPMYNKLPESVIGCVSPTYIPVSIINHVPLSMSDVATNGTVVGTNSTTNPSRVLNVSGDQIQSRSSSTENKKTNLKVASKSSNSPLSVSSKSHMRANRN